MEAAEEAERRKKEKKEKKKERKEKKKHERKKAAKEEEEKKEDEDVNEGEKERKAKKKKERKMALNEEEDERQGGDETNWPDEEAKEERKEKKRNERKKAAKVKELQGDEEANQPGKEKKEKREKKKEKEKEAGVETSSERGRADKQVDHEDEGSEKEGKEGATTTTPATTTTTSKKKKKKKSKEDDRGGNEPVVDAVAAAAAAASTGANPGGEHSPDMGDDGLRRGVGGTEHAGAKRSRTDGPDEPEAKRPRAERAFELDADGTLHPSCVEKMESELGYRFRDGGLLALALTHTSYWHRDRKRRNDHERLEILGDAVLDLTALTLLCRHFPDASEGSLSCMKDKAVNETGLDRVARRIGLPELIILGVSEDMAGGRSKPGILADTVECLVGAVYLDAGFEPAFAVAERLLGDTISERGASDKKDVKTRLNELVGTANKTVQSVSLKLPTYRLIKVGAEGVTLSDVEVSFADPWDHDKLIRVVGSGPSRKKAEFVAAEKTLALMGELMRLRGPPALDSPTRVRGQ